MSEHQLSSDDARRFRVQVLTLHAAGAIAVIIASDAAGDAIMDNVADAAGISVVDAALTAALAVAGDQRVTMLTATRTAVWNVTRTATRDVVKNVAWSGGTSRQIAYASCRSIIIDRKKIYASIDAMGDRISSDFMTAGDVVKHCTVMMAFDREQIVQLQLTVQLKMLDYLLSYEYAISFLRSHDGEAHFLLMKKHQELTRRLSLEGDYALLLAPREDVSMLSTLLPLLPIVLVKVIVEYCSLSLQDLDDEEEVYNRLLTSKKFIIP